MPSNASRMPAVILSHPQLGENIGAAARAMKNCGAEEMIIVNPRDGWPQKSAIAMAAAGEDVLTAARLTQTTDEAAAPFTLLVASTARKRGMRHEAIPPRAAAQAIISHLQSGKQNRAALLFGGERAGLTNDEIALADMVTTIPLNPHFTSLNLAHAVLLLLWECRMAGGIEAHDTSTDEVASIGERENFYTRLEAKLVKGGFFKSPNMQPVVMRNVKAIFNRARLSQQEVQTLHGVIRAVANAGKPDKTK